MLARGEVGDPDNDNEPEEASERATQQSKGTTTPDPFNQVGGQWLDDIGEQRKRGQEPDLHLARLEGNGVANQEHPAGQVGVEVGKYTVPDRQPERTPDI